MVRLVINWTYHSGSGLAGVVVHEISVTGLSPIMDFPSPLEDPFGLWIVNDDPSVAHPARGQSC